MLGSAPTVALEEATEKFGEHAHALTPLLQPTVRTNGVTLVEFLVARIAEDEEAARCMVGGRSHGEANQLLAECQAKRRLIHTYESRADFDFLGSGYIPEDVDEAAAHVLAVLALAYSGHPSYEHQWRP